MTTKFLEEDAMYMDPTSGSVASGQEWEDDFMEEMEYDMMLEDEEDREEFLEAAWEEWCKIPLLEVRQEWDEIKEKNFWVEV